MTSYDKVNVGQVPTQLNTQLNPKAQSTTCFNGNRYSEIPIMQIARYINYKRPKSFIY